MTQLAIKPTAAPKTKARGYARRLLSKPLAIASLAWLALVILTGLAAPLIAPHDPYQQDLMSIKQEPSALHLLGTDGLGRDLLSRILYGSVPTLAGVVEALVAATVLGVLVGVIAGYVGGWFDRVISQVVDLILALPSIIILFTVLAVFQRNMLAAMITLGVLGSAGVIRIIRSAAISVRDELYVDAAKVSGLSGALIIVRHIIPRVVGPIVVQLSLFGATAVLVQTGLSFLGLGVPLPSPTWGNMIYEASTMIADHPWMLLPPGLMVALTVLAFGLIGDAARDAAAEGWSSARAKRPRRVKPMVDTLGTEAVQHDPANVLEVRNLTIATTDGLLLVDDIDLNLRQGEVLGVVGESGCGKTLTALSFLGLLPQGVHVTQGTMVIDGKTIDLTDERSIRPIRGKQIGMIFQEAAAALDPCFTVEDQIREVIMRHDDIPRRDVHKRVIELLTQVKINDPEDVARRYMHQISGGMAQRVGIARALAARPTVLLADEPTTALDVTVQADVLDLLRSLQEEFGMSIIIVTHDWGVVADICDRAAVLYAGAVVETAPILEIFESPRHPYTADLLRANPHHAIAGEPLPTIAGSVPRIREWSKGCVYAPRCALATAACEMGIIPIEPITPEHDARCVHSDLVKEGVLA